MTEAEWLVASWDDRAMLEFLVGRASDRKLRLFACACCRRIWPLLRYAPSREAVEVAERYADGAADARELAAAYGRAEQAAEEPRRRAREVLANETADGQPFASSNEYSEDAAAAGAAASAACESAAKAAAATSYLTYQEVHNEFDVPLAPISPGEFLRDLFNPFHPVALDPAWLAWNDGTGRRIAEAIYQERRFDDLPILADALEEAGCTQSYLLAHCRGAGPHTRGCWAVDLVLGKG